MIFRHVFLHIFQNPIPSNVTFDKFTPLICLCDVYPNDNMMVAKGSETGRVLLNHCRSCFFSERATNPLTWLHKIENRSDTLQYLNTDLATDPTLAVSYMHSCPKCLHRNVNYHEPESFYKEHEMTLYFICRVCRHKWQYKPRGNQESKTDRTTPAAM